MNIEIIKRQLRLPTSTALVGVMLFGLGACGGGGGSTADSPVNTGLSSRATNIDVTYATQGQAVIPLDVQDGAVASSMVQADGKLLITGWRKAGDVLNPSAGGRPPSEAFVLRLNGDGTRDTSFGTGGEVRFHVLGFDRPVRVLVKADGKILVAVYASEVCNFAYLDQSGACWTTADALAAEATALVQLTSAGQFDTSFGDAGVVRVVRASFSYGPLDIATTPDGKTLLLVSDDLSRFFRYRWNLSEYTAQGKRDMGFNGGNAVSSVCQTSGEALAVQADGKIVVGGTASRSLEGSNPGVCLERINVDGSPDTSFRPGSPSGGLGGLYVNLKSLVVVPGGDLLLTGLDDGVGGGGRGIVAVRLNSAGQLNPSFGVGGIKSTLLPDRNNFYAGSVVTRAGELVALFSRDVSPLNDGISFQSTWLGLDGSGVGLNALGANGILAEAIDSNQSTQLVQDATGRWLAIGLHTKPDGSLEIVVKRLIGAS